MQRLLWISPNLNHYKARFLNKLAIYPEITLSVLAGKTNNKIGHKETQLNWMFNMYNIDISKQNFGFSLKVFRYIYNNFKNYDWIMLPREKKNIILIFFVFFLKNCLFKNSNTKLFSYNHPYFNNIKESTRFDLFLLKFLYKHYDRIIFYTEKSYFDAIQAKLIAKEKAGWANNTLDSEEINNYYQFSYPNNKDITILFIGRLIKNKNIELLFDYYFRLKQELVLSNIVISLDIIGDGPMRELVKLHSELYKSITWHGNIVDEKSISRIMKKSSFVFIPGHSGLSINHAFLYGRPYVTVKSNTHAPEINYLIHGYNGILLDQNLDKGFTQLFNFTTNPEKIRQFCYNAYSTGQKLTVKNWCLQIIRNVNC